MKLERDVWVREVGTRDGLQSIATKFPTDAKVAWIRSEFEAGVPEIEVGSFVPPKLLPQMADTKEVVQHSLKVDGLKVSVLVPNLRGAQTALESKVHQLNFPISVSEAHSRSNLNKSVSEAIDDFEDVVNLRNSRPEYSETRIGVGLATAFGCTISGRVQTSEVMKAAEKLVSLGPDEIAVADERDGDAHLYIERATIYSQQDSKYIKAVHTRTNLGHTSPYTTKAAYIALNRPKTGYIWGIYRFSLTYRLIWGC